MFVRDFIFSFFGEKENKQIEFVHQFVFIYFENIATLINGLSETKPRKNELNERERERERAQTKLITIFIY